VRGAYHFGLPDRSTGAAQAQWFATHGGAWSADNQTLPGALDIEYNPYGATCYGLSQSAMVGWLTSFVTEYQALDGRWPIVYYDANWWQTCTGQLRGLRRDRPALDRVLVPVGRPASGGLEQLRVLAVDEPTGRLPGDQDVFNGSQDDLVALANGGLPPPPPCRHRPRFRLLRRHRPPPAVVCRVPQ
jgi:hypothetical protein